MKFFQDDENDEWDPMSGGIMAHHFQQSLKEDWSEVYNPEPKIKKCVCGYDPNDDLLDCVRRVYRHLEVTRIVCPEHNLGCGRWVQGETKADAIEKWNAGQYEHPEDY